MKPAPFDYVAPTEVDDVLALLAERGEDAKVLAGGQSLMPLLNLRMARPEVVVDVNRVRGLGTLRRRHGTLHIGALTREAVLERSAIVAEHWPMLRTAVGLVGHPAIRSRGTVGGSVAHADPAAELPTALTALDARFVVRSATGERALGAEEFFVSHLTTAMAPTDLLVEIQVPPTGARTGTAFTEYARLHGDFALAGAAAVVEVDEQGRCRRCRLALLGAGPRPLRVPAAEDALVGTRVGETEAEEAAELAVAESEPPAPRDHRRALLTDLARRALLTAAGRAGTDTTS